MVFKKHFSEYVCGTRDPSPPHEKIHFKFPFWLFYISLSILRYSFVFQTYICWKVWEPFLKLRHWGWWLLQQRTMAGRSVVQRVNCAAIVLPSWAARPLPWGPVASWVWGKKDGRMGGRRKRGARVGFLLPHTVRKTSLEETLPSPTSCSRAQSEATPVSPRLARR